MMRKALFGAAMAITFLAGCGGGDEPFTQPGNGGPPTPQLPSPASAPALKTTLAAKYGVGNFPIGAAIEPTSTVNATDSALLLKHFSSITAENAMKPLTVWPALPGVVPAQPAATPNFFEADVVANFAAAKGMQLRGHTLVWHQSAPIWLFVGDLNNPASYHASLLQHLRTYITAVMERYPEIYAWDVVNEAATDTANATNPYRTDSKWYQAYLLADRPGGEYVIDAFRIAGEVRTAMNKPGMKLMLNDYNTELAGKRANVMKIVQDVINAGVPIDGVGHQFHLQLGADVTQVTAALTAVESLSSTLVNHVTELDVSIYADPGTCYSQRTILPCIADYGASPSQSVLSQQATLYRALFNAFNRPSVQSVSLWGIADNHTWLNTFPVTRTNRPLLFDTAGNPKWAFWTVVDSTITVP
jgi:endo-1,4-beta-xylanase